MAEIKKIPERSEIPEQYTWNTADMFPSDEAWEQAYDALRSKLPALSAFAGKLGESAGNIYDYITKMIEVEEDVSLLANYAQRKYDQDTREPRYQAMSGKIHSLFVELSGATSFDTPELLKISDETMERFYADKPELELYRRYLTILREKREHILSDAEEKLLAATGEVTGLPSDVFGKLAYADLTFGDAVDSEGNAHPMSEGSYGVYMDSEDRTLRESAFKSMYASYGSVKNTMAAALGGQMKQLKFKADVRKYPNTLAAALSSTRVPESVYHNLISTVNANLDKLHRYVGLRKKLLGVDELHMYDIYTPWCPALT